MPSFLARTPANNIWKMYVIRLLYWMHFVSSVLIPFFRDWGGLSFTGIMLLNAWFMLWNFLLEIPTGTVADVWGRRTSVALAFVVAAAGVLIYVSRPEFMIFLVAEVFLAAAMTLLSGADEALVYDSLKESAGLDQKTLDRQAQTVIARLESFKLGGILIGALFGSLIAKHYGLTMPFKAWLAPLAVGGILALTLHEPRHRRQNSDRDEAYSQVLLAGVRYFIDHAVLRLLALDMIVIAALSFMIIWTYQPLLEASGVDLVYFGTVHAAMVVGQILLLANVARLERLFGSQKRLLLAAPILTGISFIVLGTTQVLPIVVVSIVLVASFGLARAVLFSAHFNRLIPSEKRATVLSTISMFRMVAIAIVNPLVGLGVDHSLAWTAVGLGVAIMVMALVSRVEEKHLDESPGDGGSST